MNIDTPEESQLKYISLTVDGELSRHGFYVSELTQALLEDLATQSTTATINNTLCSVERNIRAETHPIEYRQLQRLGIR